MVGLELAVPVFNLKMCLNDHLHFILQGQKPSDNKIVLLPNEPTPCLRDFLNSTLMRNTVSLVYEHFASYFLDSKNTQIGS